MSTNDSLTPGGLPDSPAFKPVIPAAPLTSTSQISSETKLTSSKPVEAKPAPSSSPVTQNDGPISLEEAERLVEQATRLDSNSTQIPAGKSKPDQSGDQNAPRVDRRKDGKPVLNSNLVNHTRDQIRSLVDEIVELSRSDISREDFFAGFLMRTVTALASAGGAVWLRETPESPLQLHYQINLKTTCLVEDVEAQARHNLLLSKLAANDRPALVGPNSGPEGPGKPGNPTEHLLIVGPLMIDQQNVGLVEILQRPDAGPTTQRGYLRFLVRMCEIASDYLRDRQLRSFAEQQEMWQQLESFIASVHQGLNLDQTVYTIANEGRRLIDCDRVSVAVAQGSRSRCRIKAVSGLDSIERRAEQVKRLGDLATRVVAAGKPLWYTGDDQDLPPQIEKHLHEYVDKSHTKMLGIIPLTTIAATNDDENRGVTGKPGNKTVREKGKSLGALIVEQLKDSRLTETTRKRIEVVSSHSRTALNNAHNHNAIFLLPLWKVLGKLTAAFRGGALAKTAAILAGTFLVGAFLCLFPWDFSLSARGHLIPETQSEVFVQVNGVLDEITVPEEPDAIVEQGAVLARMSNNDLQAEIEFFEGELRRIDQEMATLERSKLENPDSKDRIILAGQYAEAVEEYKTIDHKLRLKLADAAMLEIRSPIRGQVTNWQLRQNLIRRPVTKGQNIMTVIDPSAEWVVELELPERRVSHLLTARKDSGDEPTKVSFTLASHPGREFTGQLLTADKRLDVHSDEGNTMLVRVAFENSDVPEELLRSGTRVTANVHCGTRSIGYVYFHELIETVHSTFVLWF